MDKIVEKCRKLVCDNAADGAPELNKLPCDLVNRLNFKRLRPVAAPRPGRFPAGREGRRLVES